jgi:two-component system NtrC family sensor kinase
VQTTLTRKFILAALGVVCLVLAGSAILSIRRERALFDQDMAHDARILVGALVDPFLETWQAQGRRTAASLLRRAEGSTGAVRIGWRPLDDVEGGAAAARLDQSRAAASWHETATRPGYMVTAVRVDAPGGRPGAILVAESLADERAYLRTTMRNHLITLISLLVLSAGGMWFVGHTFVGRPVNLLVAKARRAGAGDLGGPVVLAQRDEFRELADEMNEMCAKLADSRRRVELESEARLLAVEQLRHAERLGTVGRLASGVAHEMGTPLNVVLARADLIRSAANPDEVEQQVVAIERQVRRMSQIIRGLLDFARQSPSRKVQVDVRRVASSTASMLRPLAEKAQVTVSIADGEPLVVTADEGQLQQVLTNLVVNAVEAGRPGGHVQLAFSSVPASAAPVGPGGERVDGPAAIITVVDDGTGMTPDVQRRVFEPFFTTKAVGSGTGLGLAVSQGIIREHGGFIDLTSAVGQGSRFSVVLPRGT